jgi:hypothetical protein
MAVGLYTLPWIRPVTTLSVHHWILAAISDLGERYRQHMVAVSPWSFMIRTFHDTVSIFGPYVVA